MKVQHRYWIVALVLTIAGCATVDPRSDYETLGQRVAHAVGIERTFDPELEQADREYVERTLHEAVSADEAVQIALINNPELRVAMYEIGVSRANLVQAGLFSNPSLGIATRFPSGGGLANIDFDLAQGIAELWQIAPRKRAAEQELEQTILQVARLAVETAGRARVAYYRAIGSQRLVELAVENLDINNQLYELSEFRRDAGAGSDLDVNLTRGLQLNAELALKKARLESASARRELAMILGVAMDASKLKLSDDLPALPDLTLDDGRLIEIAHAERLDVRAMCAAVRSAEEALVLEYRRVFPNVSVGLAFEREARPRAGGRDILADTARASIAAGELTAPEIEPRSARDTDTDFVIGPSLSLELPIFDQNQAQIAKAGFVLQQRLRRLEGLGKSLEQEVREAADQARTAWDVLRFYQDQVLPQAERNLELSRESYKAGKSTILTVLEAQQSFLAAREGYAKAFEEAATALPNLEGVVGLPFDRLMEAARHTPESENQVEHGEGGEA